MIAHFYGLGEANSHELILLLAQHFLRTEKPCKLIAKSQDASSKAFSPLSILRPDERYGRIDCMIDVKRKGRGPECVTMYCTVQYI